MRGGQPSDPGPEGFRERRVEVAEIIATALKAGSATDVEALQSRVDKLAADFPLYPQHEQW